MSDAPAGYRVTLTSGGEPVVPLTVRDYPAADQAVVRDHHLFLLPAVATGDDTGLDGVSEDPDAHPVAVFPPGSYGPVERLDTVQGAGIGAT
jgi:hypothetical protein